MKAYLAKEVITEDGSLKNAYLIEDQGKIVGVGPQPPSDVAVISYENCILAPGFIDIHTHGALGYETGYGETDGLQRWSDFQLTRGVTGFLPSTASIPLPRIRQAAQDIRKFAAQPCSNILGLHMEGPFFGAGPKIGAQNPAYVQNQFSAEFQDLIRQYRDVIRYIVVDPALEAAREIVAFCAQLGIRAAAAHSAILYQDFIPKKAWGYSAVTHTFNGMVGLDHRHPGLAYAACMDPDLYAEIISDGHHVDFNMIRLFLQLKGYRKTILITDSLAAAGMPPGSSYALGGIEVRVSPEGKVTKPDGGLAGSILTMDQAVRNLVHFLDVPLAEAVYMASTAPAAMLGLDSKGSLREGKDADFVVLDARYNVAATYIQGRNMFHKGVGDGSEA